MKYSIKLSGRFKKQYKRCMQRGLPEEEFLNVVYLLAQTGTLPPQYRPHPLHNNYKGCMECHIQPDWLLIWQQNDTELVLLFVATGTHSDLFSKKRR